VEKPDATGTIRRILAPFFISGHQGIDNSSGPAKQRKDQIMPDTSDLSRERLKAIAQAVADGNSAQAKIMYRVSANVGEAEAEAFINQIRKQLKAKYPDRFMQDGPAKMPRPVIGVGFKVKVITLVVSLFIAVLILALPISCIVWLSSPPNSKTDTDADKQTDTPTPVGNWEYKSGDFNYSGFGSVSECQDAYNMWLDAEEAGGWEMDSRSQSGTVYHFTFKREKR
jgi:hypothetical protein